MATPFEEVYKRFLEDKEDETFALMSDGDLESKLYQYMEKAIYLKIKQAKKDLKNHNLQSKLFNEDLDIEEIRIIVLGMDCVYAEEQVERQIRIQTRLGIGVTNRDYKVSPNSSTLRELQDKKKEKEKELREEISDYGYKEFIGYK